MVAVLLSQTLAARPTRLEGCGQDCLPTSVGKTYQGPDVQRVYSTIRYDSGWQTSKSGIGAPRLRTGLGTAIGEQQGSRGSERNSLEL